MATDQYTPYIAPSQSLRIDDEVYGDVATKVKKTILHPVITFCK